MKSSEALMIVLALGLILAILSSGCKEPIKNEKVTVYYPDGRTVKKVDKKDCE